jgi:hypothetical protein
MTDTLLKRPSGYVPLAMSLSALAIVLGYIALFGIEPQEDEGAAAHTWQLLMAGQLPVIAYFAFRWLPVEPKRALPVLALQFVAAVAAVLPIWFLGW